MVKVVERKKKEKRGNSPLEEKQQQKRTRPASDPAPTRRSRKKKEKRGQPTLSDLGNSPLVEKQEQKRTRPASGPAPMRRSSCVNPNPDADEICHDEPEMQMGIHQKNREKQVSSSDFFRDRLNWRPMTYDEYVRYKEQVLTSDGFEVDPLPGVLACGLINTRNLRSPVESRRCKLYSQFAILKYNKKYSPELGTPKLLFVRVLKATGHVCDVMRYYITFLAKELCDGGKTKTYQAVVRGRIPLDVNVTVLSFRECEQVEGEGITFKGD